MTRLLELAREYGVETHINPHWPLDCGDKRERPALDIAMELLAKLPGEWNLNIARPAMLKRQLPIQHYTQHNGVESTVSFGTFIEAVVALAECAREGRSV